MNLNKDFKEFLELLNSNKVKYLVVGGYALGFHGYPRYTGDIDIWIGISEENAKRMQKVVEDFGFSSLDLNSKDFLLQDTVIQLGFPPMRIDVITSIDGVCFEEAFVNKKTAVFGGVEINFIGLEDFKMNKKSSGRKQDLVDLESLS